MKYTLTVEAFDTGEIFQRVFKVTKGMRKAKPHLGTHVLAHFHAERVRDKLFKGCRFMALHDADGFRISVLKSPPR